MANTYIPSKFMVYSIPYANQLLRIQSPSFLEMLDWSHATTVGRVSQPLFKVNNPDPCHRQPQQHSDPTNNLVKSINL